MQVKAIEYASASEMLASYAERRKRLLGFQTKLSVERMPSEPDPPAPVQAPKSVARTQPDFIFVTENAEQRQRILAHSAINRIKKAVADNFGLTVADIESACRIHSILKPRQVAMALVRYFTQRSFPEIGRKFGGRDHTTAIHNVRVMQPVMDRVAARMSPAAPIEEWVSAMRDEIAKK